MGGIQKRAENPNQPLKNMQKPDGNCRPVSFLVFAYF